MPPSPALRCSPGREHRTDNPHTRGHSFDIGFTIKAKDDDLALFNDMQTKEREGFLLHTADDFSGSLSKLRYVSDFKLGITIPVKSDSSDLLNADGDKNDYDWLLTPPDTPLFPSLDDEDPQPQTLPSRGRPRSQPINISRSSSMNDKTRSSRGSASPHRLSPSPRSCDNFGQVISRPFSATCSSPTRSSRGSASPHRLSPSPRRASNNFGQVISSPSSATRSSPPPVVRPGMPSRRPSTPPNKPATPTPRSSTPTLRRMSSGSSGPASSSGRRGTSPMRQSQGNSAPPKLRGWQSNLLGFSSDAPPNLRTSISDRSLPHVRGSSLTPISGRGRHSMSPTASRSASSSHSNDCDLFSSYSKGSVVHSSGDDDLDSLISSSPSARRNGMSVNSRPMTFSKKPSRTSPSNSVPKRSFESVLHQMDHRKTPQNMFRPLLSSVPSTSFYVGKANSKHRPVFSRNSLLTTSTSASSDHGASVAPDIEGSEHHQNGLTGEWERTQDPDTQEVFIFDKVDDMIEDNAQELDAGNPISGTGSFDADMSNKIDTYEFEDSVGNFGGGVCLATAAESTYTTGDSSVVDGCEIIAVCSKCGKRFRLLEVDGKSDVCQECTEIDGLFAAREPLLHPTLTQNPIVELEVAVGMHVLANEVQLNIDDPEMTGRSNGEVVKCQHTNTIEKGLNCLDNDCPVQLVLYQEPQPSDQQLENLQDVSTSQSDGGNKFGQTEPTTHPSHRIDNSEGTGISVLLLQQSSCNKWPVVQSRTFSATNILCAEPSYARDITSAMKRSIGRDSASASSSMDLGSSIQRRDSASASSSIDLGLSRQIDVCIQRQISCRKMEMDIVRSDTDANSQCSGSHPDVVINAYESSIPPTNDSEEGFDCSRTGGEIVALQKSGLVTGELDSSFHHTDMSRPNFSSNRADLVDSDAHNDTKFVAKNTSDSRLLSHTEKHQYDTSEADELEDVDRLSHILANEGPRGENERSSLDIEVPNNVVDSVIISEQSVLNGPTCRSDISDAATNSSSHVILESQNDHDSFQDLQTGHEPDKVPNNEETSHEPFVSTTSEKDVLVSTLECDLDDHARGIHEESTVIVEGSRGHTSRSLTLAEATDTILFCSSIIHDIAYKAASIGMEELVVPPEASRPTVTILGKSNNDQKDLKKTPNKHTPKSQKSKRKKLETQTKSPLTESGNNVIVQGPAPLASADNIPKTVPDSTKPQKLESKCNCTVM